MAGLVFLLVFWVLGGACKGHGVGGFVVKFTIITWHWLAVDRQEKRTEFIGFLLEINCIPDLGTSHRCARVGFCQLANHARKSGTPCVWLGAGLQLWLGLCLDER